MVDPTYARRGKGTKVGLAWAGTLDSTVAHVSGSHPADAAWRLLLDRVRRSRRPLLLRLGDEANLSARAREELAAAIGENVRVSIVAGTERNRSVATALRWLGIEAEHFSPRQLTMAAAFLGIDPTRLHATLDGLDAAA